MARMRKPATLAVALGTLWVGIATPTAALEMQPILTLDAAKQIAEACLARAEQEGWNMHVAVRTCTAI